MLKLDLARLRRDRSLVVEGSIEPSSELWAGSELSFTGPVEVSGSADVMPDGGFVVRGSWTAPLVYSCGRCTEELIHPLKRSMDLVYMPTDGWGAEDPEVWTVGQHETTVDLEEAIREEVLLEAPRYYLPEEREDGRCSACGVPVEEFKTQKDERGTDPRWAALKALKTD